MAKKELSFEEAMTKIEKIVADLESGNVKLDDSLKIYEEGNKLIKFCLTKLENAEQKIKQLNMSSSGAVNLEDFS